jgi:hypothetical protein
LDSFFIWLIVIFIGTPIGIGFLFYFIPKRLGYPRTAKYLTIAYSCIILTIAILTIFQDQLFTKNDAKELINEQGFELADHFDLLQNESSSAIGDYYHTFTLRISSRDKQEAIMKISKSKNFKPEEDAVDDLLYLDNNRYFGPRITQNYETENAYVREYFQPGGRKGYAPTFRRISINKNVNELLFEDIDE